jgi:SAM-dependent methyltransferase
MTPFSALRYVKQVVLGLLGPWIFSESPVVATHRGVQGIDSPAVSYSAAELPGTISYLVRTSQYGTLFSWSRFQSVWFSRFWSTLGPQIREGGEEKIVALLQGRVSRGTVHEKEIFHPGLSGTVLEIGAGSGQWASVFARFPTVTRVYGIEPNPDQHVALRKEVQRAGIEGFYEPMPLGIEDLEPHNVVARGSVDCVVCVLVLCGIPEPQKNIRMLYEYLKPGGRMYIYEHVIVQHSWRMWAYQGELHAARAAPPLEIVAKSANMNLSHRKFVLAPFPRGLSASEGYDEIVEGGWVLDQHRRETTSGRGMVEHCSAHHGSAH